MRLARSAAVAAVLAAQLVAAPGGAAAPAAAVEPCASGHGVRVVVDFHELGGGLQEACDETGGGRTAARLFADSGFRLTFVQRQAGFVCRVSGLPADDPCVNTPPQDAYWSLWWSDGSSEKWTYASLSADSLTVPDGGRVALSWSQGSGSRPPGAAAGADGPRAAPPDATTSTAKGPDTDDGLPGWVAPTVVVVLFAAAGTFGVVRRRREATRP